MAENNNNANNNLHKSGLSNRKSSKFNNSVNDGNNNNNNNSSNNVIAAPWRTKSVDDIELGHLQGFVAHDHDSHVGQYHGGEGDDHNNTNNNENQPLQGADHPVRSRSVSVNVASVLRQCIINTFSFLQFPFFFVF